MSYTPVRQLELSRCTHVMALNMQRGGRPRHRERDEIHDDLDFKAAKSTKTLRNLCRRPVAETGKEGEDCGSVARPSVGPFLSPVL